MNDQFSSLSLNEGGYDYKFIEEPADSLKCLICLLVVREPQQHGGCGKLFCKSCITKYRRNDCPHCRQPIRASGYQQFGGTIFNDFRSDQEVKSLLVYCMTSCGWQGELRSVKDHEKNKCENNITPCPNDCGITLIRKYLQFHLATECLRRLTSCLKCKQEIQYRDLDNHTVRKCPKRRYTCPHCNEAGVYDERTTTHVRVCPRVKIPCYKCSGTFSRCDESRHPVFCPNEPVQCKYYSIGCAEKPLRKDKSTHEKNAQLHLSLATEEVLRLKKAQFWKNALTFRIKNYKVLELEGNDYSPPFLTSASGYKMCIRVDTGKATHVSVYAYLMKGDNDDSLSWPFTGRVTFELLNQLEDDNHHKETTTFTADSVSSQRVVDGERGGTGRGRTKFISHANLDYNADNNTQYLKDDTLIFRVSAEAPDYKPWLECTNCV
ncbi:TNF receptor-associated factor 5-like [Halichondria panicea]|uniref:TNF receptor-associated factor 5-like n=1 Tax=Halichondria panicea TaxID=6063 RepID=UPI00312B47CA